MRKTLSKWIAAVVLAIAALFMLPAAANAATGPGNQDTNNSVVIIDEGKTITCTEGVIQLKSDQSATTVVAYGQTYTCTVTHDPSSDNGFWIFLCVLFWLALMWVWALGAL